MQKKRGQSIKRRWVRWWRQLRKTYRRFIRKSGAGAKIALIGLVVILGVVMYNGFSAPKVDPSAYGLLMQTIAKGESNGNYNAYFGNAGNTDVRFTEMSIAEVVSWQQTQIANGSASSAVGKYQIVRPTLLGLVDELDVDTSDTFDAALQDRFAIALMERRGALEYVQKKLSREQFAANLAKEWAALPKVLGPNPTESYYASDGINNSQISIAEVYGALKQLES